MIQMQRAAVEVARRELEKSRAQHLPTLDLTANRGTSFNSTSLTSPADMSTKTWSHQLGLQLTMPLFAGGGTQSKVREMRALEAKAEEDLAGARRNIEAQVRQNLSGVRNGDAQIKALKAALQAGESAVEGNRRGFEAGLRINSEVLNAEQQLYATMRDLMKAHVDRAMQQFRLKAAVGSLGESDLIALDALLSPVDALPLTPAILSKNHPD